MVKDVKLMIGKFVRSIRKKNNWTQTELADKTGYSPRQIKRIENGKCSEAMRKSFNLWATLTGCYEDDETTG